MNYQTKLKNERILFIIMNIILYQIIEYNFFVLLLLLYLFHNIEKVFESKFNYFCEII